MAKRRTKRNAAEVLLQDVIETLELDDSVIRDGSTSEERSRLAAYRGVLLKLLKNGPLDIGGDRAYEWSAEDALNTRAVTLQFLRSAVRESASTSIPIRHGINFVANTSVSGRVALGANGDTEDLVILQLVMLLSHVGLHNVRICKAADCGSPAGTVAAPSSRRMYVKTYRREFCSAQCQKRVYMRQRRENERRSRERRAAQRRRERA